MRSHHVKWLDATNWVHEDVDTWRNPLPTSLPSIKQVVTARRVERSLCFFSLIERGGSVAARVAAKLYKKWGPPADGLLFASYYPNPQEKKVIERTLIPRSPSAASLRTRFQTQSYFYLLSEGI